MAELQECKCPCCADAIEFGSTPQNRRKGKPAPKIFKTKTHLQKITRILCLLLCVFMLCGLVIPSVCAAIFRLTYYTEEIYAGGIVDLYAFVDSGGVAPFTYQWQAKGFGWIDLEDNDKYKGTKTNHLQLHTETGSYGDLDAIPFQCAVTDAEGTTFYTPDIFMVIYPTEKLIPDMQKWGYGLYEPTLSNTKNLSTTDSKIYTAAAYAGSKLDIFCGSKPVEDKQILQNSEVKLTRQIHITENGRTIQTGDKTTYIPYTVGANAVTVEIKLYLTIGKYDLGVFDSKTIKISTSKPTVAGSGTTNASCSLLRYTYNESEKLASIPKGAAVEVLSKEGSYYQVFYNNMVGYVGASLLNVQQPSYDPVIKNVDVTVTEPVAGERPSFTCNIITEGCQLYKTEPVTWYDKTAGRFLTSADKFAEGHSYDLTIWLSAKSGYRFRTDAANAPNLTGSINGNLPPFIHKAYEQDPEEVIELTYTFNNVKAKEPEQTHTCVPVLVERVEPTCTGNGHEAYYYCSCGMCYADPAGTQAVNPSAWGIIPAAGHKPSGWRITQVYHYKVCTACGDMLEQEDHKGGTATCAETAKCTVCGNGYGERSDHRWSTAWLYQDSTGHARICADCKTHSNTESHTPGPAATETAPQTCKDCGYILTPVKNHTHTLTKIAHIPATCTQEGNIEYYICGGCSDRFTDAAGKNKIPGDMRVAIGALGHTASEVWSHDTEYHWRTCSVCSVVLDETKMLHEAVDGKCVTCGYATGTGNPTQETGTIAENPADPGKETIPGTEAASDTEAAPSDDVSNSHPKQNTDWAMAVMIGLVCFGVSITATAILFKKKKK